MENNNMKESHQIKNISALLVLSLSSILGAHAAVIEPVTMCGQELDMDNTQYELSIDLDCDATTANYALLISANDVKLSLNDHTISAVAFDIPQSGILVTGDDNRVENGAVEGFGGITEGANILVENGKHNVIINMISRDANRGGIQVIARDGFRATHNQIIHNLVDTTNNLGAGLGVYSFGGRADFNEMHDNEVRNTAFHGIHIRAEAGEVYEGTASNNYVTRNAVNNTAAAGVAVLAVTGAAIENHITHNRIKDIGREGIIIQALQPVAELGSFAVGNVAAYNIISNTNLSAIYFNAQANATVNRNLILFNDLSRAGLHGIHFTDSNGSGELKDNNIDRNIVLHDTLISPAFSDCSFEGNDWMVNRVNGTNVFDTPACVTP